jgi:uncharacterized protein (DUF302 family)
MSRGGKWYWSTVTPALRPFLRAVLIDISYYFNKILQGTFEEVVQRATAELKKEGFGVLTEIDVAATLEKKLGVEFRPYLILGARNPEFAYQALQADDKIGAMLPCNVGVQETESGVEVAAVDPKASMLGVENADLEEIAGEVQTRLRKVITNL